MNWLSRHEGSWYFNYNKTFSLGNAIPTKKQVSVCAVAYKKKRTLHIEANVTVFFKNFVSFLSIMTIKAQVTVDAIEK